MVDDSNLLKCYYCNRHKGVGRLQTLNKEQQIVMKEFEADKKKRGGGTITIYCGVCLNRINEKVKKRRSQNNGSRGQRTPTEEKTKSYSTIYALTLSQSSTQSPATRKRRSDDDEGSDLALSVPSHAAPAKSRRTSSKRSDESNEQSHQSDVDQSNLENSINWPIISVVIDDDEIVPPRSRPNASVPQEPSALNQGRQPKPKPTPSRGNANPPDGDDGGDSSSSNSDRSHSSQRNQNVSRSSRGSNSSNRRQNNNISGAAPVRNTVRNRVPAPTRTPTPAEQQDLANMSRDARNHQLNSYERAKGA